MQVERAPHVHPSHDDPVVTALSESVGGPVGSHAGRHRWWTPVRVLLALAAICLALGMPPEKVRLTLSGVGGVAEVRYDGRARLVRRLAEVPAGEPAAFGTEGHGPIALQNVAEWLTPGNTTLAEMTAPLPVPAGRNAFADVWLLRYRVVGWNHGHAEHPSPVLDAHWALDEVRAVAERHALPTSHKPESMEICFVPDGDYAGFVEKVAGPQPGGEIVDTEGQVLGTHAGVHRFTVGQRRGLNLGGGEARYVQRIEPESRRVVVGPADETSRDSFGLLQPHWVDGPPPPEKSVLVRIRHRHPGAPGRVHVSPHGLVSIHLDSPARAVTPGQAAVVYDGDHVLGGGWIV